jgi:hypothetical protein
MASSKVRAASIYFKGRKYAECYDSTYDWDSGDEEQFGDPGMIGYSDGAIKCSLSCKAVVPVAGSTVDMYQLMKNKEDVAVTIALIDGKIHQVDMRVLKASVQNTHKNGMQEGSFSLGGGEPDIAG